MIMKRKYKYDVAISVAEEDLAVAKSIALSLKKRNINYYLYSEHLAENFGKPLLKITLDTYGADTRYVLMLASETFAKKYWGSIENHVAQLFSGNRTAYILQVRLDDTFAGGVNNSNIFVRWNSNPEEIAELLAEKIRQDKVNYPANVKKALIGKYFNTWTLTILVLLLLGGAGYIGLRGTGKIKADNVKPEPGKLKQGDTNTTISAKPEKDNPTGPGTVISQEALPINSLNRKTKPPPQISAPGTAHEAEQLLPPPQESDYYISVTGNNTTFNQMVLAASQAVILNEKKSLSLNQNAAKKTVLINLSITTEATDVNSGLLGSSCSFEINIVGKNGAVLSSISNRVNAPGFSEQQAMNKLREKIAHQINQML